MVADTDVVAISTHCRKLSLLAIHGDRVQGMQAPIWRSLASSLPHIYVGFHSSADGSGMAGIISALGMAEHCVSLRSVHVLRQSTVEFVF